MSYIYKPDFLVDKAAKGGAKHKIWLFLKLQYLCYNSRAWNLCLISFLTV